MLEKYFFHTFFLSIYLPHLPYMIPDGYRASFCIANLPSCMASNVISVCQTRDLPSGFLQICRHRQHPCHRLSPSHHWADFHSIKTCARRANYSNDGETSISRLHCHYIRAYTSLFCHLLCNAFVNKSGYSSYLEPRFPHDIPYCCFPFRFIHNLSASFAR